MRVYRLLTKIFIFSTIEKNDNFCQFFWKKSQIFGNFLTVKWQFSGGSDLDLLWWSMWWLQISMVEIYNEAVQDLLAADTKVLDLQMVGNTVKIPNITEMTVTTVKDIKEIMSIGDGNRKTASTKMNSTRSALSSLLF